MEKEKGTTATTHPYPTSTSKIPSVPIVTLTCTCGSAGQASVTLVFSVARSGPKPVPVQRISILPSCMPFTVKESSLVMSRGLLGSPWGGDDVLAAEDAGLGDAVLGSAAVLAAEDAGVFGQGGCGVGRGSEEGEGEGEEEEGEGERRGGKHCCGWAAV